MKKDNKSQKSVVFVSGIQRSGTTALANLLNDHSKICVCIERYKRAMSPEGFGVFSPDMFKLERILNFSDGLTNMTPDKSERFKVFYETMERDFDSLEYIGDKVPNSHPYMLRIHESFPKVKTIFIVREIKETASSWQARAERKGDNWPADKTAQKAIIPWNRCNSTILEMKAKYPEDCWIVDYQEFFGGDPECHEQILRMENFLGLELDQGLRDSFSKARRTYATKVRDKDRALDQNVIKFIKENADHDSYAKVIALSKQQMSNRLAA